MVVVFFVCFFCFLKSYMCQRSVQQRGTVLVTQLMPLLQTSVYPCLQVVYFDLGRAPEKWHASRLLSFQYFWMHVASLRAQKHANAVISAREGGVGVWRLRVILLFRDCLWWRFDHKTSFSLVRHPRVVDDVLRALIDNGSAFPPFCVLLI